MSGNRKVALTAGLKWLFETEQPEGAMASHHGEDVRDQDGNRRYSFVPRGSRSNRAPVVVVNVLDKKYEERDQYRELANGLDEGEMDAVAADLEALGYTVIDRWNGSTGGETGSLALEGSAHPSLLAAVALQQAGCTNKGDEHKTGSVFCGCGWAVTGRQQLVRPDRVEVMLPREGNCPDCKHPWADHPEDSSGCQAQVQIPGNPGRYDCDCQRTPS